MDQQSAADHPAPGPDPHLKPATLWSIVGVGFLARLAWLLIARPVPVSDFNDYRTLALDMLDYGQFGYPRVTAFFLPAHPTYLAGFATVSRSDMWLSFSMVVLSTLAIYLFYLVAVKVLTTKRAVAIATATFALFPTFIAYSGVLGTEHLFLVLVLGAMAAVLRLEDAPYRNAAVTGLLLGVGVLTRGEMVFYVPAFLLWILIATKGVGWVPKLKTVAVVGGLMALVVVPWYVRNAVVVGPEAGLSTSSGMNFYFAHNSSPYYGDFHEGSEIAGLPNPVASALGWKLGWEYIRANPLHLVKDIRIGTYRLFGAPDYAVIWSTQGHREYGDPDFFQREVRFRAALRDVSRTASNALFALAAASLLAIPLWNREFRWLLVPLVVSTWGLRTVIYWAMPRYAYFITALLIFAAALTVDTLLRGVRAARDSQGLAASDLTVAGP